ncbi:MAG: hypothetical protein NTZ09_11675 [Candidatus Hydrogenedentes bacterium]|nr:hypothetical protein [Candidatus Hydrogenedentota bacterium]
MKKNINFANVGAVILPAPSNTQASSLQSQAASLELWCGRSACTWFAFLTLAFLTLWNPAASACDDPPVQVILTVVTPVNGTVTVRLNGVLQSPPYVFNNLAVVEIEAIPDTGHTFLNWSPNHLPGEPNFLGKANPFTHMFYLNRDATVEAYFCNDTRINDANLEAMMRYTLGNPCDDLTAQRLESLTSLTLIDCGITDLTGLELCTGLTELLIDHNPITNFNVLAYLTNLTSLSIIGCGMDDVHPLEGLVNLEYLNLMENNITTLGGEPFCGSWGIMANAGIDAGDAIYMDGNPLTVWAICGEIRELRDREVYVSADIVCDDNPQSTGDQDGDGFTNAEEMRWVQYFYNEPEILNALFLWYIMFPNLPAATPECYASLETVAVTVEVQGQGSVYLGDGYATAGNPKTWDFARYSDSCPTLCDIPEECSLGNLPLAATPDTGWLFKKWSGDIFEEYDNPTETATISDKQITAEFVYRPEVAGLDLLAALSALFVELGLSTNAYLSIDHNGITSINGTHYFLGNGIPDAAEFLLLQTFLTQPNTDFGGASGLIADLLYNAWVQNLTQILVDMPNLQQYPLIQQACAAYMTLGDYQTIESLKHLTTWGHPGDLLYGAVIHDELYDTSQQDYFYAGHDADGDGFCNSREWEEAVESLGEAGGNNEATFNAFTDMGTDGDRAGQPNEPNAPSMPACGTCQTGTIHIHRQFVSIPAYGEELGDVQAIGPNGEIPLDQDVSLPVGTEVNLIAKPYDGVEFQSWTCVHGSAGVLPSGSRDTNITVTILPDDILEVKACFSTRYLWLVPVPDPFFPPPPSEKIDGRFESSFYEMPESWYQGGCRNYGCRAFRAPEHARYTVSCTSDVCWDGCGRIAANHVSGALLGQDIFTTCFPGGYPCEDTWTVRVSTSGRGAAYYSVVVYPEEHYPEYALFTDYTTCQEGFPDGAYDAVPAPGWEFDHWSGEETSPPSARTAVFRKKTEWQLTTNTAIDDGGEGAYEGCVGGYVTASPAKAYYSQGEQVTITACPLTGFQFSEWIGDVASPTGSPTTVTMNSSKSVTAVFMEKPVMLVQQLGSAERDVEEMGKAFITEAPAMPTLVASVPNGNSSFTVQWRLSIWFNADKTGLLESWFPATGPIELPGGAEWVINWNGDFMGGHATLIYQYCGMEQPGSYEFEIQGANPQRAPVLQALPTDNLRAIGWKESVYGHRQFDVPRNVNSPVTLFDNHQYIGVPLACGLHDGGYGIMQITVPYPTMAQVWGWSANCAAGIVNYNGCVADVTNDIAVLNATLVPKPIPALTVSDLDVFAHYRRWRMYHVYRNEPEDSHTWVGYPNPQGGDEIPYAEQVAGFVTSKPWNTP